MILFNLLKDPIQFAGFIIALVCSLSIHEAAHAWMANRLGDPTAKSLNRLSLNPVNHIDPMGMLMFLVVGFGWGNPVPFNPKYFKNHKLDTVKVALSGPTSNLLFAIILTIIYRVIPLGPSVSMIFEIVIALNIAWMIFNLLPIPPLDGSHLLETLISPNAYFWFQRYGIFILIFLLFFTSIIHTVIDFVVSGYFSIFIGNNLRLF